MYDPKIKVFIALGGGCDLGIAEDNHLVLKDYTGYVVDLGVATRTRFDALRDIFRIMEAYAIDEKVL